MSVEQMALVLNQSRAVGTDKVVLLGIANHDGDGGSWPSIATLARYANVSTRAVSASIARLRESGELIVHQNKGGTAKTDPRRRPNYYEITLSTGSHHATKSPSTLRRARHDVERQRGTKPTSTEPSVEPSTTKSPTDLTAVPPESDDLKLSAKDFFSKHGVEHPRVARWVKKEDGPL